MSALRRAIKFNFSAGHSLVAIGGGGLVYFYLLMPTRDGWMVLAAGIVERQTPIVAG